MPLPVCPYAKMVALYPSIAESIKSFILQFSKTFSWLVVSGNTALNLYPFVFEPSALRYILFHIFSLYNICMSFFMFHHWSYSDSNTNSFSIETSVLTVKTGIVGISWHWDWLLRITSSWWIVTKGLRLASILKDKIIFLKSNQYGV